MCDVFWEGLRVSLSWPVSVSFPLLFSNVPEPIALHSPGRPAFSNAAMPCVSLITIQSMCKVFLFICRSTLELPRLHACQQKSESVHLLKLTHTSTAVSNLHNVSGTYITIEQSVREQHIVNIADDSVVRHHLYHQTGHRVSI